MSSVSSVGNAAYALYQASTQINQDVANRAAQQQSRNEQVVSELIQARVKQTQTALEIQQIGSRINTFA